MAEVVTVFRGDDGDLMRKLEEQRRQIERLEGQVKKLRDAGKDTTSSFGELAGEIGKIAAGIGLWTSGTDIMRGLITAANEYSDSLRRINEQLQQTRGGAAAFASMQPAGLASSRLDEARLFFGSLGIRGTEGVNDAFRRTATLQGYFKGDLGAAKAALAVEDRAGDIGMSQDAIRQAVDVGIASGLTPEQSVAAALSVQMQTGKSADIVARAAAAKGQFGMGADNLLQGYAITGALPNILTDKQLTSAVASLGSTSNEDSKAWGRLGLSRSVLTARGVAGDDVDMERLIAASGMSREQLERAGFKGSELENLLLLSGQGEAIRSLRGGLTPGGLEGVLGSVEKNVFSDTNIQIGENIENRAAGAEARGNVGRNALLAQEQGLKDQYRLLRLEQLGMASASDRQDGGVGWWEWAAKMPIGKIFSRDTSLDEYGRSVPTAVMADVLKELAEVRKELKRTADSNEQMAADTARETPNRTPQPSGGR